MLYLNRFSKRRHLGEPNLERVSVWEWRGGVLPLKQARSSLVHLQSIAILLTYFYNYAITEFPWKELSDGASVCDVGGGIGNITLQLAKAYPTLNLKLQDLPERILQAKQEVWPKECPEAIKENRIQFEPIDFLRESPIRGCDVYYVSKMLLQRNIVAEIKLCSAEEYCVSISLSVKMNV